LRHFPYLWLLAQKNNDVLQLITLLDINAVIVKGDLSHYKITQFLLMNNCRLIFFSDGVLLNDATLFMAQQLLYHEERETDA
jgi:hypothetical protein